MKLSPLLSFFLLSLTACTALATIKAGPKGGRLLNAPPHTAEFFVTADRKVEITFYEGDNVVDHPEHRVTVIAELPSGRQTIDLTERGASFVSTQPLPAGEPYRVVVQFRTGPQGKVVNHRIDLNLAQCGECQRAEYACTCEH